MEEMCPRIKKDKCFGVYKTAGEKQEAEVIANTPPTAQLL